MNGHKYKNNKLEQHRGLLLQISIIISLMIVLGAFNYKTKNKNKITGDFVEINLEIDTNNSNNKLTTKPLPTFINLNIDTPAQFPGGKIALQKYFKKNLHYPEKAKKQNIQGRIYVKFTITRHGKIKNIKIVRSVNSLIDEEAIKLIKNMPDWTPAKSKNEQVESEQILPVIFINN